MNFMRSIDIVASSAARTSTLIAPILPLTDMAVERKLVHRGKCNFFFAMNFQWKHLLVNELNYESYIVRALYCFTTSEIHCIPLRSRS
jgi:hypothetical protein